LFIDESVDGAGIADDGVVSGEVDDGALGGALIDDAGGGGGVVTGGGVVLDDGDGVSAGFGDLLQAASDSAETMASASIAVRFMKDSWRYGESK
jgi:hypothetical protein